MMKGYSLLFLVCTYLIFIGCKSNKSISKDSSLQKTSNENDSKIYSSSTKMYLKDLEKQDSDRLSHRFIEKYAIIRIEDQYYVGAIINVDDSFDIEKLKDLDVVIGSRVKDNLSIKISVFGIRKLNTIKGILYVNIDQKVSLIK